MTVLVAPDGAVYYQLKPSDLAGVPQEGIAVPASEIIHDMLSPLFHPLVGLSPIYAAALAATQGLKIQEASTQFFANGSSPGGVITVPTEITKEAAQRLKATWNTNYSGANAGKVALLDGRDDVRADDGQRRRCAADRAAEVDRAGDLRLLQSPDVAGEFGARALRQQRTAGAAVLFSQCLQALHRRAGERARRRAGADRRSPGARYGTEFDIDDLLWMDTATRTKAATDAVSGGVLSPNEARLKYFGLGGVPGGDTPYMQQQMFSLEALAERDSLKPFSQPAAPPADGADRRRGRGPREVVDAG